MYDIPEWKERTAIEQKKERKLSHVHTRHTQEIKRKWKSKPKRTFRKSAKKDTILNMLPEFPKEKASLIEHGSTFIASPKSTAPQFFPF